MCLEEDPENEKCTGSVNITPLKNDLSQNNDEAALVFFFFSVDIIGLKLNDHEE